MYLILCRSNAIYTGIALDVAARYAQHLAGTGSRYTRANPPCRLLTKFVCPNQSVAGKLEAAIKRLPAAQKRRLVGRTGTAARKLLLTGPAVLLDEPIYYYNMGCYEALLGNVDKARDNLKISFKMDTTFRELAKRDPDLEAIRELI